MKARENQWQRRDHKIAVAAIEAALPLNTSCPAVLIFIVSLKKGKLKTHQGKADACVKKRGHICARSI